ncbi:tetratricopeptide repeat protein [Fluviicola sp.]|uniref:tetratricopeptide repeat protein n=1 Tax=Fluviicola sp. TaxID=1917219 RepID=UPI003D26DC13
MKHLFLVIISWFPVLQVQAISNSDADSLLAKAEALQYAHPGKSLSLTKMAIHHYSVSGNVEGMANSHFLLGRLFYISGAFSQSIRYQQEALKWYSRLGNKKAIAEVHSSLGTTYYFARQPGKAMQEQQTAMAIYQKLNDSKGIAITLTRIGHLREKEKKPELALQLHNRALVYCRKSNDSLILAEIYENIGSVYEDKEVYPKALEYYRLANALNHSQKGNKAQITIINNIGDCYRKMGDFKQAIQFTHQALNEARKSDNQYEERSALRDLSKLYDQEKEFRKAKIYLDSAYQITEMLYTDEGAQQVALLSTFYELEQKDRKIELLDKNKRNAKLTAWIYLQTALIICILLFVIIWRQRVRLKNERKNQKAQEVVLETKQKLMQVELDNAWLRESKLSSDLQNQYLLERELQQELQLRSQSLSSHTLQLIEKNGLLETLQQALLKAIKAEGAEKNKQLREVSRQIDFSFHRDRDWSNFEHFFAQVHSSFYDKLKNHLPDISRTEQRLCALIKLKLESKEIAIILGITVDSLRIARYRLKKRLKLDEADSLGSFIELL